MNVYSARMDETGTDGRSPIMLVGGAVSTLSGWELLESKWKTLLNFYGLESYHWKEFNDPNDKVFGEWSRLKRRTFSKKQEKIIIDYTTFRFSARIDINAHRAIKEKMAGIKGFTTESDYSLCLRALLFLICEEIKKIDLDFRLEVVVEDGPWAAGAKQTFHKIASMTGKRKPATHASRLVGFAALSKGTPSLEVADYIAGSEYKKRVRGNALNSRKPTLSINLGEENLDLWYQGMMAEKAARRQYAKSAKAAQDPICRF